MADVESKNAEEELAKLRGDLKQLISSGNSIPVTTVSATSIKKLLEG